MIAPMLAERVALVTGGARGIGLACARALARAGATVVIADRLDGEGEAAAQAIQAEGARAAFLAVDLSRASEIPHTVQKVDTDFGRIDILVNNAGILSDVPADSLTEDQWDRLWRSISRRSSL